MQDIRVAHEFLHGIGRPQNIFNALNIYQREADNKNVVAMDVLGQIYFEGKLV